MSSKKYAVFSMDVESFRDVEFVADKHVDGLPDMFDGMDVYLDLLDRYHIPATLFTLQSTFEKIPDKIKQACKRGHRLALHGQTHTAPLDLSPDEFRTSTLSAKTYLESQTGCSITGYRAPFFSMDNERLGILQELGFFFDASNMSFRSQIHNTRMDFSEFRKEHSNVLSKDGFFEFGLAHADLFHFPISGGGYTRQTPWHASYVAIRHYLRTHDYYMFYLHPFELSAARIPHVPKLGLFQQVYLHLGRKTYIKKVERLIRLLQRQGYSFVTFDDIVRSHND